MFCQWWNKRKWSATVEKAHKMGLKQDFRGNPYQAGLGFMAVVNFATSDFETCPKYQNWANFINKSTTDS